MGISKFLRNWLTIIYQLVGLAEKNYNLVSKGFFIITYLTLMQFKYIYLIFQRQN